MDLNVFTRTDVDLSPQGIVGDDCLSASLMKAVTEILQFSGRFPAKT